ncbi:MAG TPA: PilC/PilY family type IV pilus protein [Burkholderiaceae bacterium]|nr:PilC/PilY family type IV pilus protein [Burkholderiaceae bacterium]
MEVNPTTTARHGAAAIAAAFSAALLMGAATPATAQTSLADSPIFTAASVPTNVALALSVEWPTATSIANGTAAYVVGTKYYGYFDSAKCYNYVYVPSASKTTNTYSGVATNGSYFQADSTEKAQSDYSCSSGTRFSGNFLNWAAMTTIDPFRFALTGGYRSVDTPSVTILEKAWFPPNQGGSAWAPTQTTSTTGTGSAPNVTPFTSWGSVTTRILNLGQYLCFTGPSGNIGNASYSSSATNTLGTIGGTNTFEYNPSGGSTVSTNNYCVEVRVLACDPKASVMDGNCTAYPSGYKPEGLIQQYASQARFAALGYLLDGAGGALGAGLRDGGVLRARMKYVGSPSTNTFAEWDSNGVFVRNPDPQDTSDTVAACTAAGGTCDNATQGYSGVINYLNNFGQHARKLGFNYGYKGYDDVSELYYATVRYFKGPSSTGGGNVANYTNLTLSGSDCMNTGVGVNGCVDGFPVITNWYPTGSNTSKYASTDSVLYACQNNVVIGIGDIHTWGDANLPGSSQHGYETYYGSEPEVSADTTVGVDSAGVYGTAGKNYGISWATDWIGAQEGTINGTTANSAHLGDYYTSSFGSSTCCTGATYYIAGLAYDAHVNDIRPDLAGTQTITTYWSDVVETGAYVPQNQYWMAAKYGGFTVPKGYVPYQTPLTTSEWNAKSQTYPPNTTGASTVPDNYFTGRTAGQMIAGLQSAFQAFTTLSSANSTALSLPTPKISSSGLLNYSANYSATDWTGDITGSTLSLDASGNPVLTQAWDAQALLDSKAGHVSGCPTKATGGTGWKNPTRLIATWSPANALNSANGGTGKGVAFETTSLDATTELNNLPVGSGTSTQVLNYLRGDCSNEGTLFRARDHLLGDIVDANLVSVGAPSGPWSTLKNPGYSAFKTKYAARTTVVYAAANDGMLHAFDGTSNATGGSELWAYVPSALFAGPSSPATPTTNGLASLANLSFSHHFMVDSTPYTTDVDFNNSCTTVSASGCTASGSPDWHTLLIGGLGKGGKSYYAIDITDPSTMTSESAVGKQVLWEFTDTRLGYTFGQALVAKTKKYGWVVMVPSGYNNADGHAYLFFLNPKTGKLLEVVEAMNPTTGAAVGSATNPAGFAQIESYTADFTDGTIDAVYGGDLFGEMWRFDVTPASAAYSSPVLLAKATDASSNAQPITTMPLIEVAPGSSKRYVLFGTGRELASSDLTNTQINTIYSIWDGTSAYDGFLTASTLPTGASYPVTRTQLAKNTSTTVGVGANTAYPMGWYIDLGASGSGTAEQVDVNPTANNGIAAFAINLPSGSVCTPGGTGRVDAFNVATGYTALLASDGVTPLATLSSSALIQQVMFVNSGSKIELFVGGSDGTVVQAPGNYGSVTGATKLNWSEVKGGN